MGATVKEANEIMEEIQSMKRLKEETELNIAALERRLITFLNENADEYRTQNKQGRDILRFIGNVHRATLSEQSRESVDKTEVKKLLSDEEYEKVRKVNTFTVLRIS